MYTKCAVCLADTEAFRDFLDLTQREGQKLLDSLESGNSSVHTAFAVRTYFVFHAESA
ncbi:hypothetical protein [Ruminococcus flavefaciens]|uniref:hypothetical protein n=1 Tax=Ruminococcus flavefaciens TaxID=1265 RepID=UPI0015876F61|nr:hypothetical protein [Ruminococcus flavefaciens]